MPGRFEFERAIRRSKLPPMARLLALTLATWADTETGVIPARFQPSQSTLMEATGMSKSAFLSARKTLVADRWVSYDSPDPVAARTKKEQCVYRILIGARSGDDLDKGGESDMSRGGSRSSPDLGARSGDDHGARSSPDHKSPCKSQGQSQPAHGCASDPSDPQDKTAAHPSLRSGRLPSKPGADAEGTEDPQPVVQTATIPVRERARAGVEDLVAEKEAHMQGCGYCQQGPRVCDEAAEILTALYDRVPDLPETAPAPF